MDNAAIVETPRLRLRRPQWSDLDVLADLGADAEVMRYIGNGQTQSRAEVEQWLTSELNGGHAEHLPGWLVIESKQNGAQLGLAALKCLADHHLKAIGVRPTEEVGYRLARQYWGQGYATEATGALVDHGFKSLALPRICAVADQRNLASNRVLAKAGFTSRMTYALDGRTIQYHCMTREEYESREGRS